MTGINQNLNGKKVSWVLKNVQRVINAKLLKAHSERMYTVKFTTLGQVFAVDLKMEVICA